MTAPPTHPSTTGRETTEEEVSLVGIAVRLPGADDVEGLWRLIVEGRTTFDPVEPAESRFFGYSEAQLADPAFVPVRSSLDAFDAFDAEEFGIAARDAALMDPQHRVFLETVRSALDDAGFGDVRGLRVGVFGSTSTSTYLTGPVRQAGAWDETDINYAAMLANDKDFLCTRASYALGATGPSVVVQSACSSSLLAVHLARESLLRRECDIAVVGGVSISLPQLGGYLHRAGGIFSPSGGCRPFDRRADGTVKAHGAAAVVLTRMAEHDEAREYASVAGTAANNDGSDKAGFPAPSVSGQTAVIRAAMRCAGLTADDIRYIESHGTGTLLGDPIEVRALRAARGDAAECSLGSLKANLGHLDAAAGVSGLIKAALVLERGVIPPLAGFSEPNPLLELGDSVSLPRVAVDAPSLTAAGVSSFGMGGTNVHAVLRRRRDGGRRPEPSQRHTFLRTRHWIEGAAPVPNRATPGLERAATASTATPPTAPTDQPAAASCATATVEEVLVVVRRVLSLPHLGVDTDLVEAGADSLALIDVLAELRTRFGVGLDYAAVEQARDVRGLTELVRAASTAPAGSAPDVPRPPSPSTAVPAGNAVRIGPPGKRTLFLVHPAGGTTTCYVGLAAHLEEGIGLVGLSFPHEFVGAQVTMRELASRYLATIEQLQPTGPYLLGGYSFGGNLAAEMAIQLEARGERVERLVLFDSHPPHAYTAGDCDDAEYVRAFPALLRAMIPEARLAHRAAEATNAREVLDAVEHPRWAPGTRAELSRFFDVWRENHGVLKRWTPDRALRCSVLIVEASDPEPPEVLERLAIAPSTVHEWRRYLATEPDVFPVAGDHYSIFRDAAALRRMTSIVNDELVRA